MGSKWVEVDKDLFYELMKKRMAISFLTRKRVTYWGTAAKKGLGKVGPKIGDFQVLNWVRGS